MDVSHKSNLQSFGFIQHESFQYIFHYNQYKIISISIHLLSNQLQINSHFLSARSFPLLPILPHSNLLFNFLLFLLYFFLYTAFLYCLAIDWQFYCICQMYPFLLFKQAHFAAIIRYGKYFIFHTNNFTFSILKIAFANFQLINMSQLILDFQHYVLQILQSADNLIDFLLAAKNACFNFKHKSLQYKVVSWLLILVLVKAKGGLNLFLHSLIYNKNYQLFIQSNWLTHATFHQNNLIFSSESYRRQFYTKQYQILQFQQIISKIMSQGNNSLRPKIFQQWPKEPIKFNQSPPPIQSRVQKKNQSLRAEQTLHKSLMTLTNIKNFLTTKQKMKQNYDAFSSQSASCKQKLQHLCTENGLPFDIGTYEENLRNYYLLIRKQSKFRREAEAFCLSNLPNFDPKQTGIRFTRPKAQSNKELLNKLEEIERKRNRLQESLVVYEQGMQRSQILINQFDLQPSLQDLNREASDENLTQLHFLMLYKVNEAQDDFKRFTTQIERDKQSYATYQAIGDSMNLMLSQKNEMKKVRKHMQKAFGELNCENAGKIVPTSSQQLPILLKNQKVYESNVGLLARYNAETNLSEYAVRRNKYSSEIQKYNNQLNKWQQQQQACAYLYSKQVVLNNFNKKKSIESSNLTANKDIQQLKQAYVDTLNCEVPNGATSVHDYKVNLLKQFGSTMQREGIVVPDGTKLMVSNITNALNIDEENKLQKYFSFFMQLKQQPIKIKATYLLKEKNNINAMLYQIAQQKLNTNSSEQYEVGLLYCQAIARHTATSQDRGYLENVELISKRKWTGLPIGLSSFLFNYTCDVLVKNEAENYINQVFVPRLSGIEQNVYNKLQNLGPQKQVTEMAQLQFDLTPQQRRQFFFNYLHKLSDYSQSSKKKLSQNYWKAAGARLSNAYNRARGSQTIREVDKKNFFTFRVLSYLSTNGSQLKLSNFPDTIDYYLDYMNKYDYYRLDQSQMFVEITKQRMFIEFLKQKIVSNSLNLSEQLLVMEKINQACILLYQINDHALLANNQDIQTHLQHSFKLEKAQNQLIESLPAGESSELVTKMKKIVRSMSKSTVISGSKLNVQATQFLINIEGKINKFEKVNNLEQNIGFLSTTFARSQNALETIENLNSYHYTKADVITIADHPSKSIYLSDLLTRANTDLTILKPDLNQIMAIYEGDTNSRMKDPRNSAQTKSKAILSQIANKLRKMAWKN